MITPVDGATSFEQPESFEFTPENVNKLTGHLNSADFMFVIQTVAANAIIERNKLLSMYTAKKMLAELEAAPGRWIDASTGREIEDEPKP